MGLPKRKNNIDVYGGKEYYQGKQIVDRRQELLDNITKSDTYLPDSILHDDLDMGMLDFVKKNFVVISDGEKIPVIDKILTVQRWSEFTNNWEFSDEDGNVKLPFISVIRKPDVQPGTNPATQRTIPDRQTFYYSSVATWNGNQKGADIYKIPQPVAIDISFEVTIICNKFRDLNRFNKIVLQKFSSRQAYTTIKGHYIPIILESVDDNTPMNLLDGRRFYLQNYKFTMLGFLIDSEEFEVKPAISRLLLMTEFSSGQNVKKKFIPKKFMEISVVNVVADGMQTQFSVGESIGILFNVAVNGLLQEQGVDYYHIPTTSKITFVSPPYEGSVVTISYYKGRGLITDPYGSIFQVSMEYFTFTGSTTFSTINEIVDIISLDINGLLQEEGVGFQLLGGNDVMLNYSPSFESRIGITYLH
jgi:hypothetical protein